MPGGAAFALWSAQSGALLIVALLAMLLVGSVGAAIAPFAIMGAVVGFIVRAALDRFDGKRKAGVDVEGEVVRDILT